MPGTHAIVTANFGTSVSNRAPVPTANIMLKVNSPTVNLNDVIPQQRRGDQPRSKLATGDLDNN